MHDKLTIRIVALSDHFMLALCCEIKDNER